MEDKRSFEEKSFQGNLDNAIDDIKNIDLYRLTSFLNSNYVDTEPDAIQLAFLDEMFGSEEWSKYIAEKRENKQFFVSANYHRTEETILRVREYLLFKVSHRFIDLLSSNANVELELTQEKLKVNKLESKLIKRDIENIDLRAELSEAVIQSYDDEIFDKSDGWCNISDVLIKHKLLKL